MYGQPNYNGYNNGYVNGNTNGGYPPNGGNSRLPSLGKGQGLRESKQGPNGLVQVQPQNHNQGYSNNQNLNGMQQNGQYMNGGMTNGGIGQNGAQNNNLIQNSQMAPPARSQGSVNKKQQFGQLDPDIIQKIIKFQALVRGYRERKKYKQLQVEMQIKHTQYFKKEELFETLQPGQKYNPNAPVEQKTIQYKTTGSVYQGGMRGGLRHGFGKMTWADGASYQGDWADGFAQGQGTFIHKDGDSYEGEWKNNKCFGYGKYINKNGATYVGMWKNDLQSGQGEEVWPEGSRYKGTYEDGKKQGFGKYTWADGSMYSGDWYDNKINGVGQYFWKDGRKYYGQWKDNDMSGYGVYIYSDGVQYEGQFLDDKKTGYGHYFWTDGRQYEGWWYRGKQHGLGIFKDPKKGKEKNGVWEQGKRLQWFDQQTIDEISNHRFDYVQYFKEEKSSQVINPSATFDPPMGFLQQINQIKTVFNL